MSRNADRIGFALLAVPFLFGCTGEASRPAGAPQVPTRCVAISDAARRAGLEDPTKRQIAWMLISSAENSSLDWESQYAYIEYNVEKNDAENRGYTAGLVGFTSKTSDLLKLVEHYAELVADNPLSRFLPALRRANGSSSREGLGDEFITAWREAAKDPRFQQAQRDLADAFYFKPALVEAKRDGLGALGQFAYVDAAIMHGMGTDTNGFSGIRTAALRRAQTPAQGGSEQAYLSAYLEARTAAMRAEVGHSDTSRIDTAQLKFLTEGNLDLMPPLRWKVYADPYAIEASSSPRCKGR